MASDDEIKRIREGLYGAMGSYPGSRYFGKSFADMYGNADAGLEYLNGLGMDDDPEVQTMVRGLKGMRGEAVAGGIISGLSGLTGIASNAMQSSGINDTSRLYWQIDDLSRVGSYGYNNFDEISRDYAFGVNTPDIDRDEIRGMSGYQKAGAIGSGALQGATTGMQIGGPFGAAAGALIGGGLTTLGVREGDKKADIESRYLKNNANLATDSAYMNLEGAQERLSDSNNRFGAVHSAAKGGRVDMSGSVKGHINSVLGKSMSARERTVGGVTRIYSKGGVKFRIRAK